jgi:hypothetical protein
MTRAVPLPRDHLVVARQVPPELAAALCPAPNVEPAALGHVESIGEACFKATWAAGRAARVGHRGLQEESGHKWIRDAEPSCPTFRSRPEIDGDHTIFSREDPWTQIEPV